MLFTPILGDRGVSDITDIENIVPVPKSPLGQDVGDDIFRASLRVRTKDIDVLVEGTDSVLRNSAWKIFHFYQLLFVKWCDKLLFFCFSSM